MWNLLIHNQVLERGKGCNMADSRQMVRVVMWNGRGEGVPAGLVRVPAGPDGFPVGTLRIWAGERVQAAAAAEGERAEGGGGGCLSGAGGGY